MTDTDQHCDSKLLQRYRDKVLDADTAKKFERHLRSCEACKMEIKQLDRLQTEARRMIAEGRSRMDRSAVSAAVLNAIQRKRPPALLDPSWWFRPPKILFASATAVAAAFLFLYLGPAINPVPDEPSAIVRSFRAETESVMIWETPESNQTIIWFQEKSG